MLEQKANVSGSSAYQICFDTRDRFADITPQFRRAVSEGPVTMAAYLKGSAEARALWSVEQHQPDRPARHDGAIKLAFWNLERCKYLDATAARLASVGAEINLLCEMDAGMARSGQHHTTQALAARLGQGYAFAVEYVELGLGDASERALHQGAENSQGLHGNAILSNGRLNNVALVRLDADGYWFLRSKRERRLGGRIAIIATVTVAGTDIAVVCTHFESRGTPESRSREMQSLLAALREICPSEMPVLIAGDLNTNTAQREAISDPDRRAALLAEDPQRFLHPEPYEPMFEVAKDAGFDWSRCNGAGTTQRPHSGERFERKLDWIFTRGLQAWEPQIIPAVDDNGIVASDHDMLTVMVKPDGAR